MAENLVRRSVLVVSVNDHAAVAASWRHNADAVALELGDGFAARAVARERARDAIAVAARGGAEVFVRIDPDLALADITAAAWPGTLTLRQLRATRPVSSIRNVARSTPIYLRPYMLFSTHVPNASQTRPLTSAASA